MRLTSRTFSEGDTIPRNQGYKNGNNRPQLEINDIPLGTKTLAIIMDDPDAVAVCGKKWVHWTVWNIEPGITEIGTTLSSSMVEGVTDFDNVGYGGPAPPDGEHVYIFTLYALDSSLELVDGATRKELDSAMKGHVIDTCILRGRYAP